MSVQISNEDIISPSMMLFPLRVPRARIFFGLNLKVHRAMIDAAVRSRYLPRYAAVHNSLPAYARTCLH